MKPRRIFIVSFILIGLSVAFSPSLHAKSCLWKVSDGDKVLYLQGSMHLLKADNYPLDRAIEIAFEKSDVLVTEVKMEEMKSPAVVQLITQKALLSPPRSLEKKLTKKVYSRLSKQCIEAGLPMSYVNQTQPWFATMILTIAKVQKMGFDETFGLETHLNNKALNAEKKIVGLETAEFQINLLASLAAEDEDDFVKKALADMELLEKNMNTLIKAWAEGDIETVGKLINESFEGRTDMYKKFVTDRNIKWINSFNTYFSKAETHMVVIGCGHLPGKKGVLELLKKEGYKLEQL